MVQVQPRGDAPRAAASARSEQRWHLTYVAAPWPIIRREAVAAKMSTRSWTGGHQPAAMQARTPSSSSSMVRLFLPLGVLSGFMEDKARIQRRRRGGIGAHDDLARDKSMANRSLRCTGAWHPDRGGQVWCLASRRTPFHEAGAMDEDTKPGVGNDTELDIVQPVVYFVAPARCR